jgi:hypothetical protein
VCIKIAVKHGKLNVQQIVRTNLRYAIEILDLNEKQILSLVCYTFVYHVFGCNVCGHFL